MRYLINLKMLSNQIYIISLFVNLNIYNNIMDIIKNKHSLNVTHLNFNEQKNIGKYPIMVFQSLVNKPTGQEIYINIESIALSNKLEYNIYPLDVENGKVYSGSLKINRNKNNVISIPCYNNKLFFISIIIEKYFINIINYI